jgi:hypothetical protein
VLVELRMSKRLVLALSLLTAPAIAAPAVPAPPPATPSPATPIDVTFKVDGGAEHQHRYLVRLLDQECASVDANEAKKSTDRIKVCAQKDGTNFRLRVEWHLRDEGVRDIQITSELVLARGATQTLDEGTATLSVTLG